MRGRHELLRVTELVGCGAAVFVTGRPWLGMSNYDVTRYLPRRLLRRMGGDAWKGI
jgi:hypothetical protein